MNLSLLLGVSSFAKEEGRSFASAGHVAATDGATTAPAGPSGVDASALAGAFRLLVDELMSGQRADDAAPVATTSDASEADDVMATLDAPSEADDVMATLDAPSEADEVESGNAPQAPQPQMWLVELEIINRAAGVQTDLPLPAVVPHKNQHTDEQTPDVPAKSGDATESLGTLIGMTPMTQPEAPIAPTVPAPPQAKATTSTVPPQPSAADVPTDLTADPPARFASRSNVDHAPDDAPEQPRVEDPRAAPRAAKDTDTGAVQGSGFPVPGAGSRFNVQSPEVQGPKAKGAESRNVEPRTLNQHPEPGARNLEPLQSFMAPQPPAGEPAVEPVKTERANKATSKSDAPSGQPVVAGGDVRAGLVAAATNTHTSDDARERGRGPEPHATISRPPIADVQTLGAVTWMASGHDVLGGRPTSLAAPSLVLTHASSNNVNNSSLPEETTNQIVQSIRLQVMRGGGEATIRLEPKHFGEMSITIRVEQGHVTARLQAESPVVREYLQTHQAMLRESLADQQLTLGKFEVAEPPAESRGERRSPEERAFQGERQPHRRRQPATDTPFEPFEVVA